MSGLKRGVGTWSCERKWLGGDGWVIRKAWKGAPLQLISILLTQTQGRKKEASERSTCDAPWKGPWDSSEQSLSLRAEEKCLLIPLITQTNQPIRRGETSRRSHRGRSRSRLTPRTPHDEMVLLTLAHPGPLGLWRRWPHPAMPPCHPRQWTEAPPRQVAQIVDKGFLPRQRRLFILVVLRRYVYFKHSQMKSHPQPSYGRVREHVDLNSD